MEQINTVKSAVKTFDGTIESSNRQQVTIEFPYTSKLRRKGLFYSVRMYGIFTVPSADGGQGDAVERNIAIRGQDGRKGGKNGPDRAAVTSIPRFDHKESQKGKNATQQASVR